MNKKHSHPELENLLRSFWQQLCGLRACARLFVPVAAQLQTTNAEEFKKQWTAIERRLNSKIPRTRERGEIQFREARKKYAIWLSGNHTETLFTSQYVYLFARYDAFLGSLLEYIFTHKADLQKRIEKTFVYEEVVDLKRVSDIRRLLIDKEIDSIRRDAYADQFKAMESKFGISKLRSFPNWPRFVEASQRRHLFIHCNGEVTRQYLGVCAKEGYKFTNSLKIGTKLNISPKYFDQAVDLVAEVGLKLGTTLWRVLWKDDIENCDSFLTDMVVDVLNENRSSLAEEIARFAMDQKNISSDRAKRLAIVNYAQSLKWSGKKEECGALLDAHDWSACQDDFKLAVAVLREEWEDAANRMKAIGRNTELIRKSDYIEWPLFREFRKRQEFLAAFRRVYRQDFALFEVKEQRPKPKP